MEMSNNTLIFFGTIVPKPRMTRSDKWNHREVVDHYWAFKDELTLLANKHQFKMGKILDLQFCLPMPKSWSKKKRSEMNCMPHEAKPDLDNLIKSVLDCLLPDGDSQVHKFTGVEKIWVNSDIGCITIINKD